ncbi:hypothetical protein F2Q70_00007830 [Brassica cretica]|uniref:Uncharacterized protein n=1 Tax=Brassica cretica TaxID=69181 RepID=A0A8S9LWS4_BRACR|nr:hypothetical protein F2Q70_00007830 [Brassica cretica]
MKAMDRMELLGVLPTCHFAGNHPRRQFYGEFLGLAKAVWLLHLLAFSLDPSPSHYEANCGAEFQSQYMESVLRTCEICGAMAINVAGEQSNQESNASAHSQTTAGQTQTETRGTWHGRRVMNFLLAVMIFAFIVSWLFHFKVLK